MEWWGGKICIEDSGEEHRCKTEIIFASMAVALYEIFLIEALYGATVAVAGALPPYGLF